MTVVSTSHTSPTCAQNVPNRLPPQSGIVHIPSSTSARERWAQSAPQCVVIQVLSPCSLPHWRIHPLKSSLHIQVRQVPPNFQIHQTRMANPWRWQKDNETDEERRNQEMPETHNQSIVITLWLYDTYFTHSTLSSNIAMGNPPFSWMIFPWKPPYYIYIY